MGKVHGSITRAGKVKGQTPKVQHTGKSSHAAGRSAMRTKFNLRFASLKAGQDSVRVKLNSVERQVERKKFKEEQEQRIAANKRAL